MKEKYHKWYTQFLSRDFEMLVFGHSGLPIILFPPAKGKYYDCKDNGLINSAAEFIEEGRVRIYCPDTIDGESWFNFNIHPADRVKTHIAYEKVILNDVTGFAKYESNLEKLGIAGCAFGAYHALNTAFKYPYEFSALICMSGAFNIQPFIFGYYDDNCYFNNPPDYLPGLEDGWYLDNIRSMKIILGARKNDHCLQDNKKMSEILNNKSIIHQLEIMQGGGLNWEQWNRMLPLFLSKFFNE